MYINNNDDNSTSIFSYLQTIDDSTSSLKGHFTVSEKANTTNFALFAITGFHVHVNNYFSVPISYLSGTTSLSDNLDINITFARTGDIGETGATGATGLTGATGPGANTDNFQANNITVIDDFSAINNSFRLYYDGGNVPSADFVRLVISGTDISNSNSTGALTVAGGVGITGNIYVASGIYSDNYYFANGAPLTTGGGGGGSGTPSGSNKQIQYNNNGSFGGASNLIYESSNGAIYAGASIPSTSNTTGTIVILGGLGVSGNINADKIDAGGVRTTTSSSPPTANTVGDIWYNTTNDVLYRYTYDGTNYYWIDIYGLSAQTTEMGLHPFLLIGV